MLNLANQPICKTHYRLLLEADPQATPEKKEAMKSNLRERIVENRNQREAQEQKKLDDWLEAAEAAIELLFQHAPIVDKYVLLGLSDVSGYDPDLPLGKALKDHLFQKGLGVFNKGSNSKVYLHPADAVAAKEAAGNNPD